MNQSGYYRSPYDSTPSYIHDLREAGVMIAQRRAVDSAQSTLVLRIRLAIAELTPDYITPSAARVLISKLEEIEGREQ